ncbi:MAG: leucine-rich repeat domain-containing protein [Chlamydiales bacterium]|nr:leucine-rich repeat domain-containing protein [Chlamydiales bacterium]
MSVGNIYTGFGSTSPINPNPIEEAFSNALDNWAKSEKKNNPEALTVEAADKIKRCWKCGQPSLELSNLGLKTLPEVIEKLTHLKELNLNYNKLELLPHSIKRLKNLEQLHLSHNSLSSLPKSIGKLSHLKWLYLDSNKLRSLPPSIEDLQALEGMVLSQNPLKSLPDSMLSLSRKCVVSICDLESAIETIQRFQEEAKGEGYNGPQFDFGTKTVLKKS